MLPVEMYVPLEVGGGPNARRRIDEPVVQTPEARPGLRNVKGGDEMQLGAPLGKDHSLEDIEPSFEVLLDPVVRINQPQPVHVIGREVDVLRRLRVEPFMLRPLPAPLLVREEPLPDPV